MTNKDWILLLIPVVLNFIFDGIVIFVIQKFFLDRYIKRRLLKDEIIMIFLNKLKDISGRVIQVNVDSVKPGCDIVTKHIQPIQDLFIETMKFYYTNIHDLRQFEDEVDNLYNTWNSFNMTWNEYIPQGIITDKVQLDLASKLQHFFDLLTKLIESVRKKY